MSGHNSHHSRHESECASEARCGCIQGGSLLESVRPILYCRACKCRFWVSCLLPEGGYCRADGPQTSVPGECWIFESRRGGAEGIPCVGPFAEGAS